MYWNFRWGLGLCFYDVVAKNATTKTGFCPTKTTLIGENNFHRSYKTTHQRAYRSNGIRNKFLFNHSL